MARKQSGGFNKFLNFIGLVDDPNTQDSYVSDGYGRPSTYVPANQRATRTSQPGRSTAGAGSRSLPAQAGRSNTGRRTYGEDRYENNYRSGRASYQSAAEDDSYSSYQPASTARRSRFDAPEEPSPRAATPEAPRRNVRVPQRQRTVMLSLHSLGDCRDVIDYLISNNTIVLTMDGVDDELLQRSIDTLSGAVFALHANIRKASEKTYLIAPSGVEVDATYDVDDRF